MFLLRSPSNLRSAQIPWQLLGVLFGCIPFIIIQDVNVTSRYIRITKLLSLVLPSIYSMSSIACMFYAMHSDVINFIRQLTPIGLCPLVYFAHLVVFEIGIITIYVHGMICWPRLNTVLEQIHRIDVHFMDTFQLYADYKNTWRHGAWSVLLITASTVGFTVLAMILRILFNSQEDVLNMWVCFLISHTHILTVTMVMIFSSITTQLRNRISLVIQVKKKSIMVKF